MKYLFESVIQIKFTDLILYFIYNNLCFAAIDRHTNHLTTSTLINNQLTTFGELNASVFVNKPAKIGVEIRNGKYFLIALILINF